MALFLVSALLVGGYLALATPRPPAVASPPVPNAFDTFREAAELISGPLQGSNALPAAVATATNQPALERFRTGLKQQILVPLPEPPARPPTAGFKSLSTLLELEAEAFKRRGAWTNAASTYLEAIRFARMLETGVLIDLMVGLAIEKWAWADLGRLAGRLDPGERARVLAEIESLQKQREPFEAVLAREKSWARANATGLGQRLILATGYGLRGVYAKTQQNYQASVEQAAAAAAAMREPGEATGPAPSPAAP